MLGKYWLNFCIFTHLSTFLMRDWHGKTDSSKQIFGTTKGFKYCWIRLSQPSSPVIEFLHNFLGSRENSCFTFSYDPTTSRKILLQTTSCQLEWTCHLSATVFLTSEILDFLGKSLSVYVLPENYSLLFFFYFPGQKYYH